MKHELNNFLECVFNYTAPAGPFSGTDVETRLGAFRFGRVF